MGWGRTFVSGGFFKLHRRISCLRVRCKMNMFLFRDYALRFVGTNYKWGGDDPLDGYDCSGFAQELLYAFNGHPKPGTDLTAQAMYYELEMRGEVSDAFEIGALAFYGKGKDKISHVGIIIDANQIIEAGGGGSRTTDKKSAARDNAYIRLRPLKRRKDLIAIMLPNYKM